MGTLLYGCMKVNEPIEMLFGMVSGVGPDIDILDEGSCTSRRRGCCGDFSAFVPHWFEWAE